MKKAAILLLLLPLAGCIRFGAEPPKSLLTLQTAATVPVGQPQDSGSQPTILIGTPSMTQEIATGHVPVHSTGTQVAYLADSQWSDQPSRLFQRLLADTVTARTGRVVLDRRQAMVDPGAQLTGDLRDFGVDATTNEAVVTFDATLLRGKDPVFHKQRFQARVPVARIDAATVGPALSLAANQVAGQIADWVGR